MARITYVDKAGVARTVEIAAGLSVMHGAVDNNIDGIPGECGGSCACGTCQVLVADVWVSHLAPKGALEQSMLEMADDVPENLRLSCQIEVRDELDGLVVSVPTSLR